MTLTVAVRWRSEGQHQQPQTGTLDLSGDCRILADGRAEEKKSEKQRRLTGCGEEMAEVRNEKSEAVKRRKQITKERIPAAAETNERATSRLDSQTFPHSRRRLLRALREAEAKGFVCERMRISVCQEGYSTKED